MENKKGLPSFEELRKVDVSKHVQKRDGADYLNWAVVKQLLHDNGAEKVYFEPVQQANGSSLIMCEKEFKDSKDNYNRVYETRIKVTIDDLVFEIQGPVMNGGNPVKDNSMSQQRLWNSQTRLFVKGVAIYTGLGFDLWSRLEAKEEEESVEENLSKHQILKVAQRVKQKLTFLMAEQGMMMEEIAKKLNMDSDELKACLSYYAILDKFEKALNTIDKK